MDARLFRPVLGVAIAYVCCFVSPAQAQFGRQRQFTAHSQNFIVFASSPQWAQQVVELAELNRRDLAIHWLGAELPPWSERVPIHVQASPELGAGGETRFALIGGNRVGNWMMSVQGTQERILDSVLPHEITHTIFATHFAPLGKYVPRWADEGACTTVEHISEKQKHQKFLHQFLETGRGLAFNRMFNLKEYPEDIMPLYAQGHSAVQFLLDQGGPQKFVKFLETGMRTEAWQAALQEHYTYESIGQFQTMWNQWLADGSPESLLAYAPSLQGAAASEAGSMVALASNSAAATLANSDGTVGQSESNPVALTTRSDSSVSLASHNSASHSAVSQPAGSESTPLGNENWYKRRLREVTGEPGPFATGNPAELAPRVASQAQTANSAAQIPLQPSGYQSVGRVPQRQSPGIQVLDWGNSQPVPGVAPNITYTTSPAGMVPIYR